MIRQSNSSNMKNRVLPTRIQGDYRENSAVHRVACLGPRGLKQTSYSLPFSSGTEPRSNQEITCVHRKVDVLMHESCSSFLCKSRRRKKIQHTFHTCQGKGTHRIYSNNSPVQYLIFELLERVLVRDGRLLNFHYF